MRRARLEQHKEDIVPLQFKDSMHTERLKSLNLKVAEATRCDELVWIVPEFWTTCPAMPTIFLRTLFFPPALLDSGNNNPGKFHSPKLQMTEIPPGSNTCVRSFFTSSPS